MPIGTFEDVLVLIEDFLQTHPDAEWGFAHVILGNYDLDDDIIKECLDDAKQQDVPDDDEVVQFLHRLLEIPEHIRDENNYEV